MDAVCHLVGGHLRALLNQAMNNLQERVSNTGRRRLMLIAAGSLLAGPRLAQAQDVKPLGPLRLDGLVLEPIALAILHHGRSGVTWSSRRLLRGYLRGAGAAGMLSLPALIPARLMPWVPQAQGINAAWMDLLRAPNEFDRARQLNKLVGLMDAYAAEVLGAERYLLPLAGQGLLSYDYLEQQLLNDGGLTDARAGFGVLRFNTFEPGKPGALELVNLRVRQLTPSLRAPLQLYRIPMEDPDLAQRLMQGNGRDLQLLEIKLARNAGCVPRIEALRGASAPLGAIATELVFVSEDGTRVHALPIDSRLGCGVGLPRRKSRT
jgi:hypothetical protein